MYKDLGRLNAMIQKLGGDDAVDLLLAGELTILQTSELTKPQRRKFDDSYEGIVALRNLFRGWEEHKHPYIPLKTELLKLVNRVLQYAKDKEEEEPTDWMTPRKRFELVAELYKLDQHMEAYRRKHSLPITIELSLFIEALQLDNLKQIRESAGFLIGQIQGMDSILNAILGS